MNEQSISHYRMIEKIGEGGMGVVYKALDTRLDRLVAIKFLPLDMSDDEAERSRLIAEARAASTLDHPNICNIHGVDETVDGRLFIVMTFYDGITLREKTRLARMNVEDAIEIGKQIAEGLRVMHKKGIVHCDLTSKNILITPRTDASPNCVKIIDFGLAKHNQVSSSGTESSTGGTIPYMSPEQARGEQLDARTDIWSLGVVLYEMLSGGLPFESDFKEALVYSILNQDPKPLEDVPAGLERIVTKCLQKEPSNRYSRIEEILSDFHDEELRMQACRQLNYSKT